MNRPIKSTGCSTCDNDSKVLTEMCSRLKLVCQWILTKYGNKESIPPDLQSIYEFHTQLQEMQKLTWEPSENESVVKIEGYSRLPQPQTCEDPLCTCPNCTASPSIDNPTETEALDSKKLKSTKTAKKTQIFEYSCSICLQSFPQPGLLRLHFYRHTGERPYSCKFCQKTFNTPGNLYSHQRYFHYNLLGNGKKPFACGICEKRFTKLSALKIHSRSHRDERPFGCELCNKTFTSSVSAKDHLSAVHNREKPYTCNNCGKLFAWKKSLKMHQLKIKGGLCLRLRSVARDSQTRAGGRQGDNSSFGCDLCAKTFSTKAHAKNHTSRVHHGEKPCTCKTCGESFAWYSGLKEHKEKNHNSKAPAAATEEEPKNCDLCKQSFKTVELLKRHRRSHKDERLFGCELCAKTFTTKFQAKLHLSRIHHGDKPYTCNTCGEGFAWRTSLITHQKKIENGLCVRVRSIRKSGQSGKRYRCELCKKSFTNKGHANRHLNRVHKEQLPVATGENNGTGCRQSLISDLVKLKNCDLCKRSFKTVELLKRHRYRHTERPFGCKFCPKTFTTSTGAKCHLSKAHHGEKLQPKRKPILNCDFCSKPFKNLTHLEIHRRSHTGESPFGCELCEQKFTTPLSARIHLSRVHEGKKPYACNTCGKRFAWSTCLKRHQEKTCKTNERESGESIVKVEGYIVRSNCSFSSEGNKMNQTQNELTLEAAPDFTKLKVIQLKKPKIIKNYHKHF